MVVLHDGRVVRHRRPVEHGRSDGGRSKGIRLLKLGGLRTQSVIQYFGWMIEGESTG